MNSQELQMKRIKKEILQKKVRYHKGQIDSLYGEIEELSQKPRYFAE
jgi:hypothetical protein